MQENRKLNKSMFTVRLERLMHEERMFLSSKVSRDTVAAAMGTNRTYLCGYIREVYGLTFPEYINSLRLDMAIGLLKENLDIANMQGVAEQVGFTCYSSFYRAFMKRYGMSPADYIRLLRKEE